AKMRAKVIKLQQQIAAETDADTKDKLSEEVLTLIREIEDEDKKINKKMNDEASKIISTLYDEIKAVVDETAAANSYDIVFAYPDAVTPEERANPYLKELKLKPPAAQPFFISKRADITGLVLRK